MEHLLGALVRQQWGEQGGRERTVPSLEKSLSGLQGPRPCWSRGSHSGSMGLWSRKPGTWGDLGGEAG